MAKTPNPPTNMSILSTGRKFLQATCLPGIGQISTSGRFPALIASLSDAIAPSKPGTPVGTQSGTQIAWAWTASTDSGGSGLAGYRVYLDGAPAATTTVVTNAYTSTGHALLSSHTLRVEAFDNAGNTVFSDVGLSNFSPNSPLLASYAIGGQQNYHNAAVMAAMAKRHFNIVAHYPGWQTSKGTTQAAIFQSVKAASLVGTKFFQYIITSEIAKANANTGQALWEPYQYISTNKLFAYSDGQAETGAMDSQAGASIAKANFTTSGKSVAGKKLYEYLIDFHTGVNRDGVAASNGTTSLTAAVNPYVDGLFFDNVFFRERVNADYNRDGTPDGLTAAASILAIQTSHKAAETYYRTTWTNAPLLVNSADWPQSDPFFSGPGAISGTVFNQMADGGTIEAILNYESLAFSSMLLAIQTQRNAYKGSKLGALGWDIGSLTNYQMMRYGLGVSLLTGTYYYPYVGTYLSEDLPSLWFDEFDFDLGQPTESVQTTARYLAGTNGEGVWRRDYDNGIVLVGARRADGSTTPYSSVSLGGTFYKLAGSQDGVTNNGTAVSSVAMAVRDALVLSRTPRLGQLPAGHFWDPTGTVFQSMYAVYPRPDAETNTFARHRWAYYDGTNPIEYEIELGVQYGAYPYWYELITGPSWLHVGQFYGDARYGRVYGTPTGNVTNATVTIRVHDQLGATLDVTWTISTSSNTTVFMFLSPTGNNNNTGAIGSPKQTLVGVFGATEGNTTFAGRIVYLRDGSYATYAQTAYGFNIRGDRTPAALIGYPGESVTITQGTAGSICAINFNGSVSNDLFFKNMTFTGNPTTTNFYTFRGDGACQRTTYDSLSFPNAYQGSNSTENAACIHYTSAGGRNHFFVNRCAVTNWGASGGGGNSWGLCVFFATNRVLIANCSDTANRQERIICYAKASCQRFELRENFGTTSGASRGVMTGTQPDSGLDQGPWLGRHNRINAGASGAALWLDESQNPQQPSLVKQFTWARNTCIGNLIAAGPASGSYGPYVIPDNVVQTSATALVQRVTNNTASNTLANYTTATGNVGGASGWIDSTTLNLTVAHQDVRGLKGAEIA